MTKADQAFRRFLYWFLWMIPMTLAATSILWTVSLLRVGEPISGETAIMIMALLGTAVFLRAMYRRDLRFSAGIRLEDSGIVLGPQTIVRWQDIADIKELGPYHVQVVLHDPPTKRDMWRFLPNGQYNQQGIVLSLRQFGVEASEFLAAAASIRRQ